jgi:hypothetical protein
MSATWPRTANVCLSVPGTSKLTSDRGSLPDGRGTGRVGRSVVGQGRRKRLLQYRLSAVQFGDDDESLVSVVGNSTVGDVVSIPGRRGVHHIEIRQVHGRNAAGHAIDEQPTAALPLPSRDRVLRETVVHAKDAAHHKLTLSNIVRRPEDILPHSAIYDQRTNFQGRGLVVGGCSCCPQHRHPFSEGDHMRFRSSY